MFAHAGTARLDIFTDSLLLEVGEDLFLAPLDKLSALMQCRASFCQLSRRYLGTGGHYCDVEQGIGLRRSKLARRSSSSSEVRSTRSLSWSSARCCTASGLSAGSPEY